MGSKTALERLLEDAPCESHGYRSINVDFVNMSEATKAEVVQLMMGDNFECELSSGSSSQAMLMTSGSSGLVSSLRQGVDT